MKAVRWIALPLLLAATYAGNAWAGPGHARIGVFIDPFWGPWFYPPAWYYPPRSDTVIIERTAPPVYVEQPSQPQNTISNPQPGYWYYCAEQKAYYPYVKACPGGWEKVPAQPADLKQ